MRDWLMVLTPIATVIYFVAHPAQLTDLMDWFNRVAQ
jgi:hypothetical protein